MFLIEWPKVFIATQVKHWFCTMSYLNAVPTPLFPIFKTEINAGISTAGSLHYITAQGEERQCIHWIPTLWEGAVALTVNKHAHTYRETKKDKKKNTHPPRCIACQTTSPWGDTGPHVLVTTASGWLSLGWGGTELHWSPTHTEKYTPKKTQGQEKKENKSSFQPKRVEQTVFAPPPSPFLDCLFMWELFQLSITIRSRKT